MKKGGGKQKGAAFEREVCVMLSRWLTNGEQEDVFWRSAMSGGRATVAHKRGGKRLASQVGDISCIHPAGNAFSAEFGIECKFYANLEYQGLLTGKGKLLTFWNEINNQARRYNKEAFLVCRQNRMRTMICLGKSGMRKLGLSTKETLVISVPYNIHILDAEHFVKVCRPLRESTQ